MKLRKRETVLAVLVVALCVPAIALQKKPVPAGKIVDSGSFGIFINGKRVGTETFQVEQTPEANLATSQVDIQDGETKASQTSELRLSPGGDVLRYTWRELSPGKGESVVEPRKEFLVQRIIPGAAEKAVEQPYLLPASTTILDDYFFSHRELLTWRYLAEACKPGQAQCKLDPAQFSTLVPRQRTSVNVSMGFGGREKVNFKGAEQELDKFTLQSEGVDWVLWLDSGHKLVRIVVASANLEVVRD